MGYILYDYNQMPFWKREKYGHSKYKDRCLPGIEGWQRNRQSTEDFESSGTTMYDTVMMAMCHYAFVQTHGMYNTNSKF